MRAMHTFFHYLQKISSLRCAREKGNSRYWVRRILGTSSKLKLLKVTHPVLIKKKKMEETSMPHPSGNRLGGISSIRLWQVKRNLAYFWGS